MQLYKRVFAIVIAIMMLICSAGIAQMELTDMELPEMDTIYLEDEWYNESDEADVLVIDEANDDLLNPLGTLEDVDDGPDVFSLLLIGTDGYGKEINGRSDSMMLVRLDRQTGKIKIISFMRDLFVKIPGKGKTRLNAAFVYGGADLLKATLEANFGVTCDAYIAVNFAIMRDLIEEMGGIDVTITKAEMKQINFWMKDYKKRSKSKMGYETINEYGDVHLDGNQALAFSRIRNIDSDYERTRRQRSVIEAVLKGVSNMNAIKITSLVMKNIDKVKTDITLDDALKLAPLVLSKNAWEIGTFRIPVEGCFSSETISGMSVLVPNLNKNRDRLEAFLAE